MTARIRVISDNDFAGDPDGLFQLTHLLLCSSVDIRAVIPSAFRPFPGDPWSDRAADEAARLVAEAFSVCGTSVPIAQGSNAGLTDTRTPIDNVAARSIVKEAMAEDSRPLFVLVGGGLTALASAWLLKPAIAQNVTAVWIGGCDPRTGCACTDSACEYNTSIDLNAARVVFNESDIPLWQIPHTTYSQALISWDEMRTQVYSKGVIGSWLREKVERIEFVYTELGVPRSECFVLGDSPLVSLTALVSSIDGQPQSSPNYRAPRPIVSESGKFIETDSEREIRVFTGIDMRLLFGDFVAKLDRAATGGLSV